MITKEIQQVFNEAELLFSARQVELAMTEMSRKITEKLANENPIVLCVLTGAIVFTGKLLPLLNFPLQLEYIHATRYRGQTVGNKLQWLHSPDFSVAGRTLLILDDILDEGITLSGVVNECVNKKAETIYTAVLADKRIGKEKALKQADFTGLTVPNRYVFGYGMDYKGYLRNSPGIYGLPSKLIQR